MLQIILEDKSKVVKKKNTTSKTAFFLNLPESFISKSPRHVEKND